MHTWIRVYNYLKLIYYFWGQKQSIIAIVLFFFFFFFFINIPLFRQLVFFYYFFFVFELTVAFFRCSNEQTFGSLLKKGKEMNLMCIFNVIKKKNSFVLFRKREVFFIFFLWWCRKRRSFHFGFEFLIFCDNFFFLCGA